MRARGGCRRRGQASSPGMPMRGDAENGGVAMVYGLGALVSMRKRPKEKTAALEEASG